MQVWKGSLLHYYTVGCENLNLFFALPPISAQRQLLRVCDPLLAAALTGFLSRFNVFITNKMILVVVEVVVVVVTGTPV